MTRLAVGVDVGGTFTDLVSVAVDGTITARKVLSTPPDQADGVLHALDALGSAPSAIGRFVHGTTVATNTLLERNGSRVVLCATEGAVDVLDLRRQDRASLYDLSRGHPHPLVAHEDRIAVRERIGARDIVVPLTDAAADDAAAAAAARKPEIIAVALVHAHRDPSHERSLAAALRVNVLGRDVVLSSDVLPEIREYERTATTVAEAYLRPRVARYVARLDGELRARGAPAMQVMTSSGGVRDASTAAESAAALALSGPAGGVVAAAYVARLAGYVDALTVDIGGTSADAGLVLGGEPLIEAGGDVAGIPIALPRVLVETVSAGGGSIAWIDEGGALRVGPRSAGALPGPVAFRRGGTEPTVTDAHIVLGNIADSALSGDVELDPTAAHGAVARLATTLGVTAERCASAIVASADAAVARALRRVSVERGIDPRRLALVAFGGGGPLHACALAEHLGVRTVLVPPHAGVLSALGLAIAEERRESLASLMMLAADADAETLARLRDDLVSRAAAERDMSHRWWVRARYLGQGHELEVPLVEHDTGVVVAARFVALHEERYGFSLERDVELVSARHAATRAARPFRLAPAAEASGRSALRGRAVLALPDATLLVADGWNARALPTGGWLMERTS